MAAAAPCGLRKASPSILKLDEMSVGKLPKAVSSRVCVQKPNNNVSAAAEAALKTQFDNHKAADMGSMAKVQEKTPLQKASEEQGAKDGYLYLIDKVPLPYLDETDTQAVLKVLEGYVPLCLRNTDGSIMRTECQKQLTAAFSEKSGDLFSITQELRRNIKVQQLARAAGIVIQVSNKAYEYNYTMEPYKQFRHLLEHAYALKMHYPKVLESLAMIVDQLAIDQDLLEVLKLSAAAKASETAAA